MRVCFTRRLIMRNSLLLVLFLAAVAAAQEKPDAKPDPKPDTTGMILVPAGAFSMGVDLEEGEKPTIDSPMHEVKLPAFYIARHEVTNAEFAKFLVAEGYGKKKYWSEAGWKYIREAKRDRPEKWDELKKSLGDDFDRHPVVGVSWFEAEAFAAFVGKRLPTEEEWERAARGTDKRKFPWGDRFEEGLRKKPAGEKGRTTIVGLNRRDVSPVGAYDMGGNVCEWTGSWYGPYPGTKAKSRYWGEDAKRRLKVARGGSWRVIDEGPRPQPNRCRTTYRQVQYFPDDGYPFIGFRLAMDAPAKN
jgi:formylglycine-generating enzyme required for sulfatase activity